MKHRSSRSPCCRTWRGDMASRLRGANEWIAALA
jgi:hypothetical protein